MRRATRCGRATFPRFQVLVSQWVDGVKLSECEPEEIKELIKVGQEAFLVQLLQACARGGSEGRRGERREGSGKMVRERSAA